MAKSNPPKKTSFQLGDLVTIKGGVLQEYNVRLDGLTGVVTSSRYDAPQGTFAVYVDWEASEYSDRVQGLPQWVNVPPQFLQIIEPEPTLRLV